MMREALAGPSAPRARGKAGLLTTVVVLLAALPSPGTAGAAIIYQGPVVQVSGSFAASVALNPQTCSSSTFGHPGTGLFDVFEVGYPTMAASAATWYLTVLMPNPKSAHYSTTPTRITLHKGHQSWYREFQGGPKKLPGSEVHFSSGATSGTLDLTLSPSPGGRGGPVHVTGWWKPGTCAAKLAKGLPL